MKKSCTIVNNISFGVLIIYFSVDNHSFFTLSSIVDKPSTIQNMTNEKQLPEKLYRDDLLRSAKAVKQWSIEQILEEAKKIGLPISYGTVQGMLKGAKSVELNSLWVVALVLEVPMDTLFSFPIPFQTDLRLENVERVV